MSMNTLLMSYYRIVITNLTGVAPANGFVDHQKPEDYITLPTTKAFSEAKERSNMRYESIIRNISTDIAPTVVRGQVATAATPDAEATSFGMTVGYDREEYVRTADELIPGTELIGIAAVTRWVARALIQEQVGNRDFYDPTVVPATGIPRGNEISNVIAGAAAADIATAEAAITVTLINLD